MNLESEWCRLGVVAALLAAAVGHVIGVWTLDGLFSALYCLKKLHWCLNAAGGSCMIHILLSMAVSAVAAFAAGASWGPRVPVAPVKRSKSVRIDYHDGFSIDHDTLEKESVQDWRELVGSSVVSLAWEGLCGSIVQEFIYDTWYSHLTPDKQFPAEVRSLLNNAFGRLAYRVKMVNLQAVVADLSDLLIEQLELFRDTRDALMEDDGRLNDLFICNHVQFPEEVERLIRRKLEEDGNLHPALSGPDKHYAVLRGFADGMISHLTHHSYKSRVIARSVARELLAGCVLRPVVRLCSPYHISKGLTLLARASGSPTTKTPAKQEEMLHGVWKFASKIQENKEEEEQATLGWKQEIDSDEGYPEQQDVGDSGYADETEHPLRESVEDPPMILEDYLKFRGALLAKVVAAELCSDARGARDFVVYKIRVGDLRGEWTISRRYRHFEVLHRQLRNYESYAAKLPGKRFFYHSPDTEFIEERRQALNSFLQDILASQELRCSEPLWEFVRKTSERFEIPQGRMKIWNSIPSRVIAARRDASFAVRKRASSSTDLAKEGMRQMLNEVKEKNPSFKSQIFHKNSAREVDKSSPASSIEKETMANTPGVKGSIPDGKGRALNKEREEVWTISAPLYDIIDSIFQLRTRGFFRRQVFAIARQALSIVLGDKVEEYLRDKVNILGQESTVARLIGLLQQTLWPGGRWMHAQDDGSKHARGEDTVATAETYVEPLPPPPENEMEVRRSTCEVLEKGMPNALSALIGRQAYRDGSNDLLSFIQSQTFTLSLAYGIIEVLSLHVFPEMKSKHLYD